MRTLSPMTTMAAPDAEADPAKEEAAAIPAEDETAAEKAEEEAVLDKKVEEEAAASQDVLLIWVQPGHDRYFIGQPVPVPASDAEFLRAAGRAREATDAEIKAWKDASKAAD